MTYYLYKCYIAVESWGCIESTNVDYLWAEDASCAKEVYITMHEYRRNKKGLTIEQIPYHRATRTRKVVTKIVTEHTYSYLGSHDDEVYKRVPEYYCSNCKNKIKDNSTRYCPCCDAELFEGDDGI